MAWAEAILQQDAEDSKLKEMSSTVRSQPDAPQSAARGRAGSAVVGVS